MHAHHSTGLPRPRSTAATPTPRAPQRLAAMAVCRRRAALQVRAAVKAPGSKQVCCSKTLVSRPEAADAVAKLCAGLTTFSLERAREAGSGIRAFECVRDGWESHVFHFWERYDSNAHMGRHHDTPEVKAFMEQVNQLLQQPVGMALYEYQGGQLGAVSIQGGPKGEGGLDDATGASGAAGGASLKQTSSAVDLTQIDDEEDEARIMESFQKNMGEGVNKGLETIRANLNNLLGGLFAGNKR